MSTSNIPSLGSLRAIEAALRLGSISRAAEELHVTHGAVSKHVLAFENEFGITLAKRLPRCIEPTPEGAKLGATLTVAFGLIDEGIKQLKPGPLLISCSASVMMRWLIPKLADFHLSYPGLQIQIVPDHGPLDLMREGIGLAIRNDVVPPPQDVVLRPLMQEWIGPVCSPEYRLNSDIKVLSDLRKARLLVTSTRASAWSDWFESCNWSGNRPTEGETYPHFHMALHAAACGLGIAMAPRYLVSDDIKEGRLVAPYGFVRGHRNVVMWLSNHIRKREDIKLLSDWLYGQIAVEDAFAAS